MKINESYTREFAVTIVLLYVVHKDFGLENATQLGKSLDVRHVDDDGSQAVVQNHAQFDEKIALRVKVM